MIALTLNDLKNIIKRFEETTNSNKVLNEEVITYLNNDKLKVMRF